MLEPFQARLGHHQADSRQETRDGSSLGCNGADSAAVWPKEDVPVVPFSFCASAPWPKGLLFADCH